MSSTTGSNESYGWCSNTSRSRITANGRHVAQRRHHLRVEGLVAHLAPIVVLMMASRSAK
jgi:hypothetical protein